jgi:serine/threonine protein kinase
MLQPGTLLGGRYKIESLVGHGGTGTVYCAHDERLGREVAIKVLRPDFAADAAARERFLREGQIAAQFVHPHVVRTFDAGEDPAETYLVQEFLTGRTLDKLLPLPPPRAADIMQGVAAALGYMHSRGYIHCDVKPQNILIKDNGVPVLLDFGIARAEGVDTTTLIATPHYLAPERVQGARPSSASDLYALGIVLFQAVAAHPPFDGPDVHAIIQQHIETPVPPLPSADPAARVLDRIIARLTAKRPEDRYASADAVEADLAAVSSNAVHDQPTIAVASPLTVANPAPAPEAAAAVPPVDSTVGSPRSGASTSVSPPGAPAWRRGWFVLLAIPLLLLLGFGIARPRTQVSGTASAPALSAITATVATTSPISTTTPQATIAVPGLVSPDRASNPVAPATGGNPVTPPNDKHHDANPGNGSPGKGKDKEGKGKGKG